MAFTRFTKNVLNVSALPDRVQNQAQTLKATFDQAGVDIKTALNALIVELEASTSADNIGADVQSVATKTVQAILTAFEEAIADRYTKTEAETLLAIETNNLLADLDINLTTGVITTTKKDGTKSTIDTAIEKVPSKFEFVESGDTYLLKITNVDGTITQADVTKLMNIYNFNNSDYITFEVTGEGNKKTVTANIKANSIGLDKLSLSVVSTLEGYMNSARDSATAAKTSETNARASELNALEAKNTAVAKANEASASASAAKTSETNAEYWAKQAQAGGSGGGITEIPVATADTLGGIKVGEGLSITEDGTLSAIGGSSTDYNDYYEETELLSAPKIYTASNARGSTAIDSNLQLTDDITNYDEIVLTFESSSNQTAWTYARFNSIKVSDIVFHDSDAQTNNGSLNLLPFGTADVPFVLGMWFKNANTLWVDYIEAYCHSGTTLYFPYLRIRSIKGIKYNITVLDGTVAVDSTPTEGSTNVVTSGGVKAYVDEHGVKVLEASTDNVIDFNTLTETGMYLIKKASNGVGTTLNSPYTATAYTMDIFLDVKQVITPTGELSTVGQTARINAYGGMDSYSRSKNISTGEWTDWSNEVNADRIRAGVFGGQMKANSTAVSSYGTSQIRNIKAQTTDLTAGTSTLTTGDIVLIYE